MAQVEAAAGVLVVVVEEDHPSQLAELELEALTEAEDQASQLEAEAVEEALTAAGVLV